MLRSIGCLTSLVEHLYVCLRLVIWCSITYRILICAHSCFSVEQAPKPSSGPHKARECLPLILILRNRLKYALTYREVISILMQRHVMVDGKVRTDKTYPSGFMGRLRARCDFGCMSNVMAIASYRLNYCLPESCRCCVNSEDWGEFPPSLWYQGALPSPQYQGWWGQGNASQVPIEVFFFFFFAFHGFVLSLFSCTQCFKGVA